MPAKLESPYSFRERILVTGQGGAGKTQALLSIIRQLVVGDAFVVDNDYSYAYSRALETDFEDIKDRVHVFECEPTWDGMTGALRDAIDAGRSTGDEVDNWLGFDSISPSWEAVQSYITEQITGSSSAEYLTQLRRDSSDLKEMSKALVEQVPWNIVKKEYGEKIWQPIRDWKGHLFLTAEAKKYVADSSKPELANMYAHLGQQPTGESRIHYVTATHLLLSKGQRGVYKLTSIKDRNREDQEGMEFEDFGVDYLRGVAGWKIKVVRDGN